MRGRALAKIFELFRKNLTVPKTVAQCRRKLAFHILKHALPILIHWLGFWLHILIHALPISILWLGFRFSAPYLNTCITYSWVGSRLHILIHAILMHWLGFRLSDPNTCITCLNTLSRLPILIHWVGSLS